MKRVRHNDNTWQVACAPTAQWRWVARGFSKVENAMAGRFPKAAAVRLALALLVPVSCGPGHAADIVKGAELYRQHCASCHGHNGRPSMVGATDFSQPTALLKPDMHLLQSIRAGRGAMPAYQGLLRDRDLLDIVAHLRTLR
jgi:cytochrome c6